MTRGNKIVEQVDKYGDIVFDYDTIISKWYELSILFSIFFLRNSYGKKR